VRWGRVGRCAPPLGSSYAAANPTMVSGQDLCALHVQVQRHHDKQHNMSAGFGRANGTCGCLAMQQHFHSVKLKLSDRQHLKNAMAISFWCTCSPATTIKDQNAMYTDTPSCSCGKFACTTAIRVFEGCCPWAACACSSGVEQ
jgi:hypothetical protein